MLALIGLPASVPASVDFYLSSLADILNLDILKAEETSERLFHFSKTDPYSHQIEQLGMGTTTCILNMSDLFYAVCVLLLVAILSVLLTCSNCKCESVVLNWLSVKIKWLFKKQNIVKETLLVLYTAQMSLLLSAVIELTSPPEHMNAYDRLSQLLSIAIVVVYLALMCGVVPWILVSFWKIPIEDRDQSKYPEYHPIVSHVNLRRKTSLVYPLVNLTYRMGLCALLLSPLGSLKSGAFCLMTFLFTCYTAGCRPFEGVN